MNLCAELEARQAPRSSTAMPAGLRPRGEGAKPAQVVNVSTSGCAVSSRDAYLPGTPVWVRFPGLEPWEARIVWSDGETVGIVFVKPLHQAVLDRLLALGAQNDAR